MVDNNYKVVNVEVTYSRIYHVPFELDSEEEYLEYLNDGANLEKEYSLEDVEKIRFV